MLYQVAVNFPKILSTLTYASDVKFSRGDIVSVPLGRRTASGVVLRESNEKEISAIDETKIKSIVEEIDNAFSLSKEELDLYEWMSKYYHYSLGKLVFDCLPKILKRPRTPNFIEGQGQSIPFELNHDQLKVVNSISQKLAEGFSQHYIHGVTGSGKSAVYLSLMKETIRNGKSVQFLLPEINLTPQFTQMFATFLGCKVLTYHSGVTPSEKYNIWKHLNESDEPVLVMGVRSSIFLPIKNLGLVIVDEEHDQSFKQTDRCPYNGRDVAIKKSQLNQCPIVLGSATPTLENFYLFESQSSKREYYELKNRVSSGGFPKLVLLDTKGRFTEKDPAWPFLDESIQKIESALNKNEQVLVFINKLGYSQYLQCRNCAHQFYNENCGCQNNLRYFKRKNCLSCSHCDFSMPAPDQCPSCGGISLLNKGFGTEKVEQVLQDIFPERNIERFDRDEIKTTKDLNDKLTRFHNQEIDVFVGTQMLAKGHNFKRVNLVIVLGVDSMLNYADFRSSEKAYQLIEQVAGRAGRYAQDSEVVIQTMNKDHGVFEYIAQHSFNGFYKEELPLRELCYCPPYSKMAMIYFSSRFRERLIEVINNVGAQIHSLSARHFKDVRVLGPTPLMIEKKANQFSWGIMLKSHNINQMHQLLATFESNYQDVSNVSYKIDIDPVHIL